VNQWTGVQFLDLPFGDAFKDTYSVGRHGRYLSVTETTDAAEKWLNKANAYPKDYGWSGRSRSSPPTRSRSTLFTPG